MPKIWKFGDNINTDQIIPGRYYPRENIEELGKYCFCELNPRFAKEKKQGDVIVAGNNFGCGSSREYAVLALKYSGMKCVIAKSFARIFFRNCINTGFPILICDINADNGDKIGVDLEKGEIIVNSRRFQAEPLPEFVLNIVNEGGIINYIKKHGV